MPRKFRYDRAVGSEVKSVKVHDDTHRALKLMKESRRGKSIDQVIRELIRESTGEQVRNVPRVRSEEITKYLER